MTSNIKHHNFTGSVSADFKQGFNFNELLIKNGYDINRFEPIGIEYNKEGSNYNFSLICFDKLYSTPEKEHLTSCLISDSVSIMDLFLNLNISLVNSRLKITDTEIKAKIILFTDDSHDTEKEEKVLEVDKE